MARLAPQKRLDDLIRAFAQVRSRVPCRLRILGEGPERPALEELARTLGVADDVDLPGWADDPFPCLARAACFVLSSAWEGMPNALIQARALGLPVVATDCPSGPAEVLDGGREGRLVPVGDVPALADGIAHALVTARSQPPAAWRQRFELDRVAARYLDVLRGDAPRPLRILLVTTSLMRGGAENQVVALATGLHERGHAVHVVTMRDPEAHADSLEMAGIPVASLGMRRGRPDPRGLTRLAREVRRFRPDVVHAHMVHANLLARLARPLAWAPVLISTAHNVDEGARWRELAYRITDPLGDGTTHVCEAGVQRFVRVGAAPAERIEHVPNGIDVGAFTPDPEVRRRLRSALGAGDAFVWLAVGRLEPQKDVATLLRALARHDPEAPPMRTWIVGDGPDREALTSLASDLGLLPERVTFLGERSDVPDLMRAADGYLMSSAWEGLPIVLLEAACAGLPIVATDVGGVREIVRTPAAGRLVPPRRPDALADAMRDVAALRPDARAAMGRAARADVRSRYDLPRVLDLWEARYRATLPRAHLFGGAS